MPSTGRSGDNGTTVSTRAIANATSTSKPISSPSKVDGSNDLVAVQREQAQRDQHGRERDQTDQRIAVDCSEIRLRHLLK